MLTMRYEMAFLYVPCQIDVARMCFAGRRVAGGAGLRKRVQTPEPMSA